MKSYFASALAVCLLSAGWGFCQSSAPSLKWGVDNGACCESGTNWWIGADYLLWWFKDAPTPPLVTAGTPDSAGILGRPGTTVLFGGPGVDLGEHHGIRVTAGLMFDEEQLVGIEGNYFILFQRGASFNAASAGDPVLARPFFNANRNAQDSELVASPGIVTGSVRAALDSQLQGAEANLLCLLADECEYRVTLLAGFRYAQLDEGLTVSENLLLPGFATVPGGPAVSPSAIGLEDFFGAHSHFYGGQIGLRGEWWHRLAFVRVEGKAAIGLSHESVNINGSTQITSSNSTSVHSGGLLALPSNIGRFHRDEFAVLPEIGVKVGYQITPLLAVTAGYSFLYWSDVARPGDQVDFTLNPSQLPTTGGSGALMGVARPAAALHGTDFWAHGLNVGLELRY